MLVNCPAVKHPDKIITAPVSNVCPSRGWNARLWTFSLWLFILLATVWFVRSHSTVWPM